MKTYLLLCREKFAMLFIGLCLSKNVCYVYTRGPVQCTLKGTEGLEAPVGTEASLSPSSVPLPSPSHCGPQSPVCWQPPSCHCHSHALMTLAPLAPFDNVERLGLAPAAGANTRQDHSSVWGQRIFSNHQRLTQ